MSEVEYRIPIYHDYGTGYVRSFDRGGFYIVKLDGISGLGETIDIHDSKGDLTVVGQGVVNLVDGVLVLSGTYDESGEPEVLPQSGFVSLKPTKIYQTRGNEVIDLNGFVMNANGSIVFEESVIGEPGGWDETIGFEYEIEWS